MRKIGLLLLMCLLTWNFSSEDSYAKEITPVVLSESVSPRFTYTYSAYGQLSKDGSQVGVAFYLEGHSDVYKITVNATVKKDGTVIKTYNKTVSDSELIYGDFWSASSGTYTMSGTFTVHGSGGSEIISFSDSLTY